MYIDQDHILLSMRESMNVFSKSPSDALKTHRQGVSLWVMLLGVVTLLISWIYEDMIKILNYKVV